jgi:NADH-quinone oxidoreductase subunit L
MFRLYYNIFWGKEVKVEHGHTPHESSFAMLFPLMILALITVFAGLIPFGEFVSSDGAPYHIHLDPMIATISVGIAVTGILLATILYRKENSLPTKMITALGSLHKAAYNRFYIDEIYLFVTKKIIFNRISTPVAWFDRHVIDATMNGLASITQWTSARIRFLQSGKVQHYALAILLGTLIITALAMFI